MKNNQTVKRNRCFFAVSNFIPHKCGMFALAVLICFSGKAVFCQNKTPAPSTPKQIFGLTVDNVSDLDEVVNQLKFFKSQNSGGIKPMVRVVFDPNEDYPLEFDEKYLSAIRRMKQEADVLIMGQILDSTFIKHCIVRKSDELNGEIDREKSKKCFADRTRNYLEKLGNLVDVWEIGNEVNGEWAGWNKDEWKNKKITAKDMEDVRETIKDQIHEAYTVLGNKKKALTFYFNDDGKGRTSYPNGKKRTSKSNKKSIEFGSKHGMFEWAKSYHDKFPDDKIDYVLISYYQDDNWSDKDGKNAQIVPDAATWAQIFNSLHSLYKDADIGFGEVGAQCYYQDEKATRTTSCIPEESDKYKNRGCSCCLWAQTEYANRYYLTWDMNIRQELNKIDSTLADKYVGGYFWWHFNPDIIDKFTRAKNENLSDETRKILKEEGEKTRTTLVEILRRWRGESVSTNLFLYNAAEFAANPIVTKVLQPGDSKTNPYTIVIVNNPAYLEKGEITADAINKQPERFAESVNYIYANLFGNLPHQAEKFLTTFSDKIRVIAIYAPRLSADESHTFIEIDGQLVARQDVLTEFLKQRNLAADVVFAVSDYPATIGATAWRAIDDETGGEVDFTYDSVTYKHYYQTKMPGAVAIHANTRSMTALHEFGHAASSNITGYIGDLYKNDLDLDYITNKELFTLNKKYDKKYRRTIPPIFCVYNNVTYKTDTYRDKNAKSTIHAERIDSRFPALMDDYTLIKNGFFEQAQHDKFTRQFLLDRIKAKTER